MKKLTLIAVASFAILNLAIAQNSVDSVYLLRMPDKQNTYVRIPNTGAFFIKEAGLKADQFGWQLPGEFVESDSNMLYFEMNSTDVPDGPWNDYTAGSVELVINIPNGITTLNLDTINRLRYHLINNYGERGSPKDADNQLTGLLRFEYTTDSAVIITGEINIKTKKPFITDQQVVFSHAKFGVFTKARFLQAENVKEELKQQQEKALETFNNAIADDKRKFFDSIFTKKMAENNRLTGVFNGKQKFDYLLNQSYILTRAVLYLHAQGNLMDMLGSNFLEVDAGVKNVYLMHCFYDPAKNVFDDEINFSLGIELDSIMDGKTFIFHKRDLSASAILGYWHYGPSGRPILSNSAEGTVTITGQVDGWYMVQ